MEQYNYTQPEDVDYYMSDTDSEIGSAFVLPSLLEDAASSWRKCMSYSLTVV